MKKNIWIIILIVAFLLNASDLTTKEIFKSFQSNRMNQNVKKVDTVNRPNTASEVNGPINIQNDATLAIWASEGDGSVNNPYQITNIIQDAMDFDNAITINNTRAYVRFENISIEHYRINGIKIANASNIIITNVTVWGDFTSDQGINIENASGIEITNNSISEHVQKGINILNSTEISIKSNKITENGQYGMQIVNLIKGNITNNHVFNEQIGIDIEESAQLDITNNIITENDNEGLFIDKSSVCEIAFNNISKCLFGMSLSYFNESFIRNNTITQNSIGMEIYFNCTGNIISGNLLKENIYEGIHVEHSFNNIFSQNQMNNNSLGLKLDFCNNISIYDDQYKSIRGNAISLYWSANNSMQGILSESNQGACFYFQNSSENLVYDNVATDSLYGIILNSSHKNTIVMNIVAENAIQEQCAYFSVENAWDNGHEGNYWGNYSEKNPNAKHNGRIWNQPYLIDGDLTSGSDNYPLVGPKGMWMPFTIYGDEEFLIVADYGEGTVEHPYIIANRTINGLFSSYIIDIRNTTKYFRAENISVFDSPNTGIYIENCSNIHLLAINTTSNNIGIQIINSSEITIKNGFIAQNKDKGVIINNTVNSSLVSNLFMHNYGSDWDTDISIHIIDSTRINISANRILESYFAAIQLENSSENIIQHNYINDTRTYAILISDSLKTRLENNTIQFVQNAISIMRTQFVYVKNTQFDEIFGYFIIMENVIISEISLNNLSTGGVVGIFLNHVYQINCSWNILRVKEWYGIWIENASECLFMGNEITYIQKSGIFIESRIINCTFKENIISHNQHYGIYVQYSPNCQSLFHQNILINNTLGAINLSYCIYFNISNNIILANEVHGIALHHSVNGTVLNNNIKQNQKSGIYTLNVSYTSIFGNNITLNGEFGIYLAFSVNNSIWLNFFIQNSYGEAWCNNENNSWSNSSTGNYWGDYSQRYSTATHNEVYWNQPYQINGTLNAYDTFPMVWNISPQNLPSEPETPDNSNNHTEETDPDSSSTDATPAPSDGNSVENNQNLTQIVLIISIIGGTFIVIGIIIVIIRIYKQK